MADDDFFANMLAGDAQKSFDAELNVGTSNGDQLLSKLGVPTGRLTDASVAAFEKTTENEVAQLVLQRKLTAAAKTYTNAIAKIAEEENKRREQGILTQQKLNELKAEAAKAWAKYQSATQVLMVQTKNDVNLIGFKTAKEINYQNQIHLLAQEKETARYESRFQQAEARHQSFLISLRESIAASIAKFRGNSQLPQGQTPKVFGIFEGKKERA
ncbi:MULTISPECIES: hypothetical protein [unclassified Microcoleus]|uniref:hypothetical protein n=1 Tax=unclassified Microcoleus TaxID=2642155 RepID=UPI002FD64105